ncbi:MAG: S1/P1 nuclease [Gammaproteobacteria bacterium]|nr:S1/P1 nuclease [Gammaproteobacteria bacterium]MDP2347975.1 S1/P1 nuclease [Gammaproteobacteria bacterium]
MTLSVRTLACLCLFLLQFVTTSVANAWDATSHRLSIYVAWETLSLDNRNALHQLLQRHPRFQEDFLDQMPAAIMLATEEEQVRWLLGQAAIWPDMARGFQGEDAIRYNRPDWHWIDGAWVRGGGIQGNIYVGTDSHPTIAGSAALPNMDERDATNIVLALDYNLQRLTHPLSSAAQRAVALCWLLHLVGDIHQPLHSGALLSSKLFASGDRGGNGIATRGGSLHAIWDEALRSQPFEDTLQRMIATVRQTDLNIVSLDSSVWLQESRQMMHEFVYPDEIKAAVLRSERRNIPMPEFALDDDYIGRMSALSEDRVTLAGIRLSLLLQRAMSN